MQAQSFPHSDTFFASTAGPHFRAGSGSLLRSESISKRTSQDCEHRRITIRAVTIIEKYYYFSIHYEKNDRSSNLMHLFNRQKAQDGYVSKGGTNLKSMITLKHLHLIQWRIHHGLEHTESDRSAFGRGNQQLRLRPEEIKVSQTSKNAVSLALAAFCV